MGVRGKDGVPVEFGLKFSMSLVDGYATIDRTSWSPYNESKDLIGQIESYKTKYGYYPESVHADKIYHTRENISYCKELGIRLSGSKLGRPKASVDKAEKRQQKKDALDRIAIEGRFGQAKRRFSLDRIYAKLTKTSLNSVYMIILVTNLEKQLHSLFVFVQKWLKNFKNFLFLCKNFVYFGVKFITKIAV